jgi:hypothetical protein
MSPDAIRRFQKLYLAASLIVSWIVASWVAKTGLQSFIAELVLAIGAVTAGLVLARSLIPKKAFILIRESTSGVIKLALIVNLLTAIVGITIVISVWKAQALVVAVTLAIVLVSAWFFCAIAWPLSSEVYRIFFGEESTPPDPLRRQGRTPEYD